MRHILQDSSEATHPTLTIAISICIRQEVGTMLKVAKAFIHLHVLVFVKMDRQRCWAS